MKQFAAIACLLLMTLGASPSSAHSQSTSFLVVSIADRQPVTVSWDLALHDLMWSVFIDADYDRVATWAELLAARASIANAALAQIQLARGGVACTLEVVDFAPSRRADHVTLEMRADCPQPGPLRISGPLFTVGDPAQRVLLSVHRGPETLAGVLSATTLAWDEPRRESAWASFGRFIGEGVWHVLIGYDHVAFVLLLLLPSVMRSVDGRWQGAPDLGPVTRDLVTIVTAFTIAHSTTLALAVTGTVLLPEQPVEVAIAASIAAAALLNLLPRLWRWRMPLAFGFGFVHGFGFANALDGIDADGVGLLPLLAGFNVGVELAQLAIVAAVLPLLYVARGTRWYSGGVLPLGSCALGAAGVVWLIQRL